MVTCSICKKTFKKLTASHLKTHNISYKEYIRKFENDLAPKECAYENNFYNWKCPNQQELDNHTEYCILHNQTKNKDQEVFKEKLESFISKQENDKNCTIIHLDGIHFPTDLIFRNKKFKKNISFSNCIFYNKFEIMLSTFEKGINFYGSIFYDEISFKDVDLLANTNFTLCKFYSSVIFSLVLFHGVSFYKAIFNDLTRIRGCDFEDYASFRCMETPEPSSMIQFYFISFFCKNRTWFEESDMEKISFIECDLRYIIFRDMKWLKLKWPNSKRKCLIDEFKNFEDGKLDNKHYERIRNEYQQLKQNFEESKNYTDAGDFYYGEMECKRKSLELLRFFPTLTTIYWASTGYGERVIRAGFSLLFLIVIWITCLMFLGLEANKQNNGYNEIDYELKIELSNAADFAKDFLDTYIYVQEILLREEKSDRIFFPIKNENEWISGDGINAIGFILVYVQLLLFALAVRRRFKR